mmetsp:Transcript_46960/g.146816  ORF Transcript_46960/g.146816 Transcript_46960/m.146816 type:complete len:248 (-) Transcript_46960:103-846(-)
MAAPTLPAAGLSPVAAAARTRAMVAVAVARAAPLAASCRPSPLPSRPRCHRRARPELRRTMTTEALYSMRSTGAGRRRTATVTRAAPMWRWTRTGRTSRTRTRRTPPSPPPTGPSRSRVAAPLAASSAREGTARARAGTDRAGTDRSVAEGRERWRATVAPASGAPARRRAMDRAVAALLLHCSLPQSAPGARRRRCLSAAARAVARRTVGSTDRPPCGATRYGRLCAARSRSRRTTRGGWSEPCIP